MDDNKYYYSGAAMIGNGGNGANDEPSTPPSGVDAPKTVGIYCFCALFHSAPVQSLPTNGLCGLFFTVFGDRRMRLCGPPFGRSAIACRT
jgi:hypothetical protein